MRRRHDRVVDRLALRHVLEILLLQAELAVLVQHEVDRLAVVLPEFSFELTLRDAKLRRQKIEARKFASQMADQEVLHLGDAVAVIVRYRQVRADHILFFA